MARLKRTKTSGKKSGKQLAYKSSMAFILMSQLIAPLSPAYSSILPRASAAAYSDVDSTSWAYQYITKASALGVIEGDGSETLALTDQSRIRKRLLWYSGSWDMSSLRLLAAACPSP